MAPSAVSTAGFDHLSVKRSRKPDDTSVQLKDVETTKLVLDTFRCLIADLCEQFKGGHPG